MFVRTSLTKIFLCPNDDTFYPYLNFDSIGDYPVHYVFCERVKVFVCPSHELRFQQVAAVAVVLKHPHVQLHREVWYRGMER